MQARVLHISTPLSWRGGEQQLTYLLNEMEQAGRSFALLCPEGSVLSQKIKNSSFPVHLFRKRGGTDPFLARKLARLSKSFDLVHAHDAQAHTAAVLANAFFGARIPVVLSRRVDFPVAQSFFSAWKYNHSSVKRILCVSDFIADMVRADVQRPERVCTVHSGIDVARFHHRKSTMIHEELGLGNGIQLVGNVSALADHKDYFTFLDTIQLLVNERTDVHAVIIGTGPMENEIRRYAQSLNLHKKVTFMGFKNNLEKWLPCLDVLLFPSKTEGLGTSVLDAMACGVPVVASNAGGIPELVKNEENGLLVQVKDAEGFFKACMRLLDDKDLRNRITANAKQTCLQFTYREMARKTIETYDQIL